MARMDPLSDAMVNIKNNDLAAKGHCRIRPASRLLGEVLRVMQENRYISTYERVDDGREGVYEVNLLGKINECRSIKPRYAVRKNDFEAYERRYLPARDIGLLIVSTPHGVLTHAQAKEKGIGGRLLAYVY